MEDQEEEQEEKKDRRWFVLAVILLVLLLFSLGAGVYLVSQRTTFFGRAFGPSGEPVSGGIVEVKNSYLFASPLEAKADGQEKIRATVFILDDQGLGVAGKPVFLGEDERLEVLAIQAVTDDLGRAIFDISASQPSEYLIEARVENKTLPQRVKLSFR